MNWIRSFDTVGMTDVASVGGRNASLGEMRRALTLLGVRTPDGFATTADAYRALMRATDLERVVRNALADIDISNIDTPQAAGAREPSPILPHRCLSTSCKLFSKDIDVPGRQIGLCL
jgi:pyruvate,water dikinase